MGKTIRILCVNTNQYEQFPLGSTVKDVYEKMASEVVPNAIAARVNNKTVSLQYELYKPKQIEFINTNSSSGMRAYVRTLTFVLSSAVSELYPGCQFKLEHPVSKGYFCALDLGRPLQTDDLAAIKNRAQELIRADYPIEFVEEETPVVVEMFRKRGRMDIVDLLTTQGSLYSGYFRMGEHIDYYYGALAITSGCLNLFDISLYFDGILLQIPNRSNPSILQDIEYQPKLLGVFKEYLNWNHIMSLNNVGDLNKACLNGESTNLINISESLQEKKMAQIADSIYQLEKVRMVLISGPSSSGKTTFAKRLAIQLMVLGIKPVAISLDNYFVDREQTPRDKKGDYDFESLYALDLDLFNRQLKSLIQGEEVETPVFNFALGKKEYKGDKLKLTDQTVLILEGIHALNPNLLPDIPKEVQYKVYVSALTSMSLDDHNWIPTTDNRLLRRIIRDFRYRGYSARETISRWESVREGEDKWIFPYQENADSMFNSALIFEFSVLRSHAEPILRQVPQNCPEYAEAHRLLRFVEYFLPISDPEIPPTSLLREFLGGSSFRY
ncbi:MAG TPA: nucleoside kinase [Bacteroidales bacterium]|nr:nucleoside kinase [Bacteroidales bacterium]